MRGCARPYSLRSGGFSSTTRSSSSDDRLEVRPDTSVASGWPLAGATIFHSVPDFCRRVRSPDSDLTEISSILSGSTVKTLSFFGPSSPAGF